MEKRDDVVAGPHRETGLEYTRLLAINKDVAGGAGEASGSYKRRSQSMPTTRTTPSSSRGSNVWRSVFQPGSNPATKGAGANLFDRPQPNSPTVYDWLYSDETRSKYR